MRWTWCMVLVLAACDSGAPSCKDAVGAAFARGSTTPEDAHVREALVAACTKQSWSSDVRTCLVRAKDGAATDACLAALTPDQLSPVLELLAAPTARLRAATAELELERAKQVVADLERQLHAMSADVDAAVDRVAKATSQADRDAAKQRLEQLEKEKADLEAALTPAHNAVFDAERKRSVKISQECLDNPLAMGCQ